MLPLLQQSGRALQQPQQQPQAIDLPPRKLQPAKNSENSSKYRFTLDSVDGVLTTEQRDFYEENGYIIVKNMVTSAELGRWHDRFHRKELAVAKDSLNVNTLYKIGELYADEVLFEYCRHPKVLDHVQQFTGPNVMAIHTMLINKPPDTGSKSSRHPLHQDLHYFPNRPADRIVCAWTAMERITRENGCLVAVPGTHKGEHLEHDYPDWEGGVNKLYYGIQDPKLQESRVHLLMDEGDTALVHGSGVNRTSGYRKAISCHYSTGEAEFIDVKGTIQEKLADETLAVFQKRFPAFKLDYITFWKLRARLVRGTSSAPYQYLGSLTAEQRAFYAEHGYLVLKSLVSQSHLSEYNRRFEEYATGARKPSSPELVLLREVSSLADPLSPQTLYKLNELYVDEVLFGYPVLPAILDAVQSIVGPNIMMINSMLINKPPDKGTKSSRHPLHQDLYYFPFRPADRITCAWTAMERITRENGALVVVPGSHRGGLLRHEAPQWAGGVNLHFDGIADYQSLAEKRVHLAMDPGDCVLFHSALVHGSGVNRTAGFRRAISAHYAPVEATWIEDGSSNSSEQTAKVGDRLTESIKKKFGVEEEEEQVQLQFSYSDFWKIRGRQVRGEGCWEL
ncbi:hypothetical protein TYRP_016739 [Tyrophagus putrescentiae]|nr:hypothetical protein TYRP_016739 [Tyrophagus putrescentiae]